ncbi:MAG: indolepyruvate oxidoreductase subunit beta [Candidatus Woesearchaeota archaeon]
MKKEIYDTIIVGVGGQGVLTIAAILARAAVKQGFDVKASELHGLAVRFGSLSVHLRIGKKKIMSPMVGGGNADLLIAHEPLEALKALKFANKDTVIMFDTKRQIPNITYRDEIHYPLITEVKKTLKSVSKKVIEMDATYATEKETKYTMLANAYILGRVTKEKVLPLSREAVLYAMKSVVPEKSLADNIKIFNLGYKSK